MEFTIENGKLYMLQTRNGKRTAAAALKIAVDLVDEGMISEEEAVLRVEPKQLDRCCIPSLTPPPSRPRSPSARAWPLPPAPLAARWSSLPRTPRRGPRKGREGGPGPSGDLP